MYYQFYELNHAAMQPYRALADVTRLFYTNPLNPWAQTIPGVPWRPWLNCSSG